MIKFGTSNIVDVLKGEESFIKAYKGSDLVFSKSTPTPTLEYIADGLVADFRGEDDYVDGAWVDRVSGYKFTPVSSSTAPVHDATNKLYQATSFGGMRANFMTGTTFTLEFVFRDIKNMTKASASNYSNLVGTNMSGWSNNNGVVINKTADNSKVNVQFLKGTKSTYYSIPFTEFVDGKLDTIVIIPGVGFFKNGVLLKTCGSSVGSGNIGLFTHYDQTNASSYKSKGKIHAVRKYNRALTAEEVLQNYQTDLLIYGA